MQTTPWQGPGCTVSRERVGLTQHSTVARCRVRCSGRYSRLQWFRHSPTHKEPGCALELHLHQVSPKDAGSDEACCPCLAEESQQKFVRLVVSCRSQAPVNLATPICVFHISNKKFQPLSASLSHAQVAARDQLPYLLDPTWRLRWLEAFCRPRQHHERFVLNLKLRGIAVPQGPVLPQLPSHTVSYKQASKPELHSNAHDEAQASASLAHRKRT